MNVITSLDLLNYLHDGILLRIEWDCTGPARRLVMLVEAHDDSEYEPWNGKRLTITMSDVLLCRLLGHGVQLGSTTIDGVSERISNALEGEFLHLKSWEIPRPPWAFAFLFHDGSELELMCREVTVEAS